MSYRIDNPGGGDCGFYALAIGLIATIQKEYEENKKNKTFTQWQKKGLNHVSLPEILDIDLNQLYESPYTYKKETLLKLQMSLRDISATAYKNDLLKKIAQAKSSGSTQVESSPVYHKFMELVHYYLKEEQEENALDKIKQFNELALSPEVLDLAQKTAKSLEPKLQGKSFEQGQKIENAHVKEALMADVLSGGKENSRSVILKGIEKIKEQGRWATHSDLKEVAEQLEVNLYVTNELNGAPKKGCPTIVLNNEGQSIHWTTTVEELPAPKVKPVEKRIESPKPIEETHTSSKEQESSKTRESSKEHESSKDRESRVIAATVSTQINEEKAERYQQHVKTLMVSASDPRFFASVQKRIENLDKLDKEEALKNEHGAQIESDEDFAIRLQEAEFRRANLK
ncbi:MULTISPECIES: hypothetical protein [Legionella]|uniref:Dot/Icm T4SS effector n=1 Tax=Legionella resiliens TaxID=2905958 RepID=A0ABS8X6U8_9GAMM|nr:MULTISPECIES: hypothetical protein [unclassified Legionella]MCE0724521.1 hypothetical protein [Legionella sp. 9fVS26]MCE3533674.1 hypothetical protein [Legionella sp. 8cVS16]QLZ69865.1 hypothetical protein FOLKNPGA_02665 [Legionella sp. PC1000]